MLWISFGKISSAQTLLLVQILVFYRKALNGVCFGPRHFFMRLVLGVGMLALSLQYDKRHSGYLAELKDAEEVGESQDGCLYRPHQD